MIEINRLNNLSSSRRNFNSLLALRTFAIAAWCVAIAAGKVYFNLNLPVVPLTVIVVTWIGFSLISWFHLRMTANISERKFLFQLVVDILMLSGLLYFSGGPGNPFTMLYLLPLTITAVVLPARATWGLAALAVACYSLLLILDSPLAHADMIGHGNFVVHILGMWLGFVFAAGLIAYFVGRMGSTLREHEQALAQTREQALRDENVVALGTMAAGAAHELGTPLGSILIITRELSRELSDAPAEIQEQLRILAGQVERCKNTLAELSSSAGQLRAEEGCSLSIEEYLKNVIAEWQDMRPSVKVHCQMDGVQPSPMIIGEKTLSQAIINIFNNAADASPESVEIDARWTEHDVAIEVRDQGNSLTHKISDNAGKSFFSSKKDGLGIGLFLAHATIGRLGGFVELFVRQNGGGCTQIRLPLLKLLTGNGSGS